MAVWVARFVLVALAVFAGAAHATNVTPSGSVSVTASEGSAIFQDLMSKPISMEGRTWSAGGSAGVKVAEDYAVKVGTGSALVRAARVVPLGPIAAVAGAAYTGWEIGSAMARAMGIADERTPREGVMPSASGPAEDGGSEPTLSQTYSCVSVEGPSPVAACTTYLKALAEDEMRRFEGRTVSYAVQGCPGIYTGAFACAYKKTTVTSSGTSVAESDMAAWPTGKQAPVCKAYIDALNPALSVPYDHSPMRSDGKCGTGRYSPTSMAKLVAGIKKGLESDPEAAKDVAKEVVEKKGKEIPEASERSLSGPASATGEPTVRKETSPAGDVTTTTTTPTYTINYGGDTMTWNTTNITTVQKGDAAPVKTVEETKPKEETQSECEKSPNTIGCSEYGEPDGGEVQRTTKNINFEPGAYPDGGTCPAARTFDLYGHTYSVAWTPICDGASTYVRPIVLVLASALGAFIFIGGLKA